jgi:WD40 repeat protein
LPYGAECKTIKTSSNGKFGAVSVSFKEGMQKGWFKLAVFDPNLKALSFVFQKDTDAKDFILYDFSITNDGNFLAGAGKKNHAWVFVVDVKNEKIVWEKTFDKYDEFPNVIFSIDGKTIYASNSDRFVCVFETATGNLIRSLEMKKYPTSSTQLQTISCVAVSPDGRIYAAASQPSAQVYLWDTKTGKELCVINAKREIPSGLAFSPDSSLLAVSDLVRSSINVFQIPEGL